MKKKSFMISIIIIIIGIIIVAVKGFNVDLIYRAHKAINIPIGSEYNLKDVESITNEVFGKEEVILEKAGLYNDTVIINVKDASDEQVKTLKDKVNEKFSVKQDIIMSIGEDYAVEDIQAIANEVFAKENMNVEKLAEDETYVTIEGGVVSEAELETLNNKINEKYGLTNEVSSINVSQVIENKDIPRVRLTDMAKQYIFYTIIATVLVLIYFAIRFRKAGVGKVLGSTVFSLIFAEMLYMAIIAITRFPINKLAIIAAFAIYLIILTYLNKKYMEKTVKQ